MNILKKIRIKFYKRIGIAFLNRFLAGTSCFKYKRHLLRCAGMKIGKNTKIVGPIFITANVTIGDNCWIGAFFKATGNGNVIIGNCVDIAPEVTISTGSHEIGNYSRRAGNGMNLDIKIEDGCWICSRACLSNGVTIRNGTVVAAGAVVVKTFEENCLLAGVPASPKKKYQKLEK